MAFQGAYNFTLSNPTFIDNTQIINSGDTFPGLRRLVEHAGHSNLHNSRDRNALPRCYSGTRIEVIQEIKEWIASINAGGSVMLLEGSLGVGKSTVAHEICNVFSPSGTEPRQLLASYFFSWKSQVTSVPTSLIATIAVQILAMIPEIEEFMEKSITDYRPDIFTASFEEQIHVLLIQPIRYAATQSITIPRLLVIDGLNECQKGDERSMIIRTICGAVRDIPIPLRVLITTRPQPRLRGIAKADDKNRVLTLTDNTAETEQYLRSELTRIRDEREILAGWPREEDIVELLNRSPGGFIYPSMLVKFIVLDNRIPQRQLEHMLAIPIRAEVTSPFSACYNFVTVVGEEHIVNTLTNETLSRPYHNCLINPLFKDDLLYLQKFVFSFLATLSTDEIRTVLIDVHSIFIPPCPY